VKAVTSLFGGIKDLLLGTVAAAVVAALCTVATAQWVVAVVVEPGFKPLCKILRKLPSGDKIIDWIDKILHLISEKWPPEEC